MKKVNFQIFNHLIILGLLFLTMSEKVWAQKYEVGGGAGVAAYSGDIIRRIDPNQLGLQGTLFGKRNFDNVWTLRVGLNLAQLNAADSIKPIDLMADRRDARFRAGVIELDAVMEFNFLDFLRNDSEFRWSPYAFFGLGYSFVIARGNTYAFNVSEDYSLSTLVIPFGGGVKYRLDDRWTLALEIGLRPTFTDYLDKIDSSEPVIPRFQNPNAPNEPYGINFGNPNDKDWYYTTGLTISYTIASTKCYAY
ncbi:type IX secretion system protein PorG [Algoriphagus namhaensis]